MKDSDPDPVSVGRLNWGLVQDPERGLVGDGWYVGTVPGGKGVSPPAGWQRVESEAFTVIFARYFSIHLV